MANTYRNSLAAHDPGIEPAKQIIYRLFRNFDGCFRIRLWDGSEMNAGRGRPEFSLTFRSPRAFQSMVFSPNPLRVLS